MTTSHQGALPVVEIRKDPRALTMTVPSSPLPLPAYGRRTLIRVERMHLTLDSAFYIERQLLPEKQILSGQLGPRSEAERRQPEGINQ